MKKQLPLPPSPKKFPAHLSLGTIFVSTLILVASARATTIAPSLPHHSVHFAAASAPTTGALFPIVGLIAAITCTQILRRRKMAQLALVKAEE